MATMITSELASTPSRVTMEEAVLGIAKETLKLKRLDSFESERDPSAARMAWTGALVVFLFLVVA